MLKRILRTAAKTRGKQIDTDTQSQRKLLANFTMQLLKPTQDGGDNKKNNNKKIKKIKKIPTATKTMTPQINNMIG